MGGGGGGNPDGKEQHRRRRREIERRGRLWRRRREAPSLPGDERYFSRPLNNRISLGAAMYFGMYTTCYAFNLSSSVGNAAESLVAMLKWM